jgi:Ca2+-binding RTX toxin-like protein
MLGTFYRLPANVENLVFSTQGGFGFGNELPNRMVGKSSADRLDGGPGSDILTGRGGSDIFVGGPGNDILTGGEGRDFFNITAPLDGSTNVDRITDFDLEEDEILLVYKLPWNWDLMDVFAPRLAPSRFIVGPSATTTEHRIVYNPENGTVYHDSDGSGPAPAVPFAKVSPNLALTYRHFRNYFQAQF